MAETSKGKKVFGIVGRVLTFLFYVLCILVLILCVATKKNNDGAANFFGKQVRIVLSDSMEKCEQTDVSDYKIKDIPVKSMLFIEQVPSDEQKAQAWYAKLKKGDVLTFRYVYVKQETITHRLVENPIPTEGGYILHLEGDNKASDAKTLTQTIDTSKIDSPNYVIGKVTGTSYPLGVTLTALKTTVGMICIIILPCLLLIGWEIYHLISICTESKREKQRQQKEQMEEELRQAKEELELLRQKTNAEERPPEEELTQRDIREQEHE